MSDEPATILEPRATQSGDLSRISAIIGVPRDWLERSLEAELPVLLADGRDEELRTVLAARGLATALLRPRSARWPLVRSLLLFCALSSGAGAALRALGPGPPSAWRDLSVVLILLGLLGLAPTALAALRAWEQSRRQRAALSGARALRARLEAELPGGPIGPLFRRCTATRGLALQAPLTPARIDALLAALDDLQRTMAALGEAEPAILVPLAAELDALDAGLALGRLDDGAADELLERARAAAAAARGAR